MPGPSSYNREMKKRADRQRIKQNIRQDRNRRRRWRRYGPQGPLGDGPKARNPKINLY